LALQQVSAVESGSLDLNEDLVGGGHRAMEVLDLENFRAAVAGDDGCVHGRGLSAFSCRLSA
jgi:hypothetical protein